MYAADARAQQASGPNSTSFQNHEGLPLSTSGTPWEHGPLIPGRTEPWQKGEPRGLHRSVWTHPDPTKFDVMSHDSTRGTTGSKGYGEFVLAEYRPQKEKKKKLKKKLWKKLEESEELWKEMKKVLKEEEKEEMKKEVRTKLEESDELWKELKKVLKKEEKEEMTKELRKKFEDPMIMYLGSRRIVRKEKKNKKKKRTEEGRDDESTHRETEENAGEEEHVVCPESSQSPRNGQEL